MPQRPFPHPIALALAVALLCATAPALAAPPAPQDGPASCIEVEVDGARAPSYACLSERLRPAAPNPGAREATLGSEAIVQRPGNQLGVFNRAATANRMGNTFGTSVYPQRPPVVAPVMPFGPRP